MKYQCPDCKSLDVVFWKEVVTEKLYRFKKDGTPYKKSFRSTPVDCNDLEGLVCLNCKSCMNWIDDGTERWERETE